MKIKDWKDVTKAMARIGTLERDVEKAKTVCQETIARAEREYEKASLRKAEEAQALRGEVGNFALAHQEEFEGRTMKLDTGSISLRSGTVLDVPDEAKTIRKLEKEGDPYKVISVKVTKSLLKSALANLADDVLRRFGIIRRQFVSVKIDVG